MATPALKRILVPALTKHTATVIIVHGLGDSGSGWEPVARMIGSDPALKHIKWVLPDAPIKPVTANFGMRMPTWYDITSWDFSSRAEDEAGMLETVRNLNELITLEVDSGVPSERIILGGFSQGAAMSLLTGLTTERKLGGLVILSGYLALSTKIGSMLSNNARNLKIFWGHGEDDPLVKIEYCENSVKALDATGIKQIPEGNLTLKRYRGLEHSTSNQELADLKLWLAKSVPQTE